MGQRNLPTQKCCYILDMEGFWLCDKFRPIAAIIYWGYVHEASGSSLARHFQVVVAWGFLIFTAVRYQGSGGRYAKFIKKINLSG